MLFLMVVVFSKDSIKIGLFQTEFIKKTYFFEKCQKKMHKISGVTPPPLCSTKFGSVPGVTPPLCAAISVG